LLAIVSFPAAAADEDIDITGCDRLISLVPNVGPYDYTNPEHRRKHLPVVEKYHFSTNTEMLIKGDTSVNPWDDLAYVVRIFPNHHRALVAMSRYKLSKRPLPMNALRLECYFHRAFKFKPEDAQARLVYAEYVHKSGKLQEALKLYKEHEQIKRVSLERDYNLGMLYFQLSDYKNAQKYAEKVYKANYPFTELREKLESVGHWREVKR